ncbi:hypothetical protein [Marivita sp.]|uniref:hypothetical protein n=1 Tax=Marivita sp. TaxID=2003365 RepID=UPI00344C3DDC
MKPLTFAACLVLWSAGSAIADPATECGGSSQVEIGNCVADTLAPVDATIEIYLGFAKSSAE